MVYYNLRVEQTFLQGNKDTVGIYVYNLIYHI
jgi:hypothetical protein